MNPETGSGRGRAVVIGLDGTPYSFLQKEMGAGNLPHLAQLAAGGILSAMETEIPTISSVSWASFMTGANPGEHGIFGFTDRKPGTYELYFPNYTHLKVEPVWNRLSAAGRRCCVINVPSTYPARPLGGVMVSGFVAPNLEKATYPREAFDYLSASGYRIDVDAAKGRESLDRLLEDLHQTLEKRREAMLHFWQQERWDLFVCVFTGTDRLHHFLWRQYEEGDPVYAAEFRRYYRRMDEIVGEFTDLLPAEMPLFMLSDHGCCSIRSEVFLNTWLAEQGYLDFRSERPMTIADIDPSRTRAYCMDPGRIYLNLKGREPGGIVEPEESAALLAELSEAILDLKDPASGARAVQDVFPRDDLYQGAQAGVAPDLVAQPVDGYDIKGMMGRPQVFAQGHLTGMHTYADAFSLSRAPSQEQPITSIRNFAAAVLQATG